VNEIYYNKRSTFFEFKELYNNFEFANSNINRAKSNKFAIVDASTILMLYFFRTVAILVIKSTKFYFEKKKRYKISLHTMANSHLE